MSHLRKELRHAAHRVGLVGLCVRAPLVACHTGAAAHAQGQAPAPPFPAPHSIHAQVKHNEWVVQVVGKLVKRYMACKKSSRQASKQAGKRWRFENGHDQKACCIAGICAIGPSSQTCTLDSRQCWSKYRLGYDVQVCSCIACLLWVTSSCFVVQLLALCAFQSSRHMLTMYETLTRHNESKCSVL